MSINFKIISLFITVILILTVKIDVFAESDFYAYYTNVSKSYNDDDHSDKYTDVIIHYSDDMEIHFSRDSSYLPCLITSTDKNYFNELDKRSGDGSMLKIDKYNKYSHVRLIENSTERIVVHWRYLPDFSMVDQTSFNDEYFNFYPSGKVERFLKKGTEKIDDWQNKKYLITQLIQLQDNGIKILSTSEPIILSENLTAVEGTELKLETIRKPTIWFKFDDATTVRTHDLRDVTSESISGKRYQIKGNKTLWKKGVSGTALNLDGYSSGVTLSNTAFQLSQSIKEGFTIESWISIGAYPWKWAPIIHQSDWEEKGFYLGVDYAGHLGFMANIGGTWEKVISKNSLELFKWIHVAATFDLDEGILCIYVNGKLIRCKRTKREINPDVEEEVLITADDRDLIIGLNNEQMIAENAHRQWTYPTIMGFDGLIDEVRIYDKSLRWEEIRKSYELYKPSEYQLNNPDLDFRSFPANPKGKNAEMFGAHYAKLDYYDTWDNLWRVSEHSDVVIGFEDKPVRFAFWRGLSYGIAMITENGKWSGDQSREAWGEDYARGCCEHMSDKQCRHSHVRIIENTDARAVVHWRYGEVDVQYKFVDINGPFADEYWTFYPDGVGIRHVASGVGGWQETMFYSAPGTRPEDNVELQAFTVIDENENEYKFDWTNNFPFPGEEIPASVTMVNMKSEYKPFYIYPTGSTVSTFVPPLVRREYSAFHWANHYPVSQMASDGRSAEANDRTAHSSLVWGDPTEDYLMVGLSNKNPKDLIPLARSWNYPPKISNTKGCNNKGYKPEERTYILEQTDDKISFKLNGEEESPIYNPSFVIKNWNILAKNVAVKLNGKELIGNNDFKQGLVRDVSGKPMLILWLNLISTEQVLIELREK